MILIENTCSYVSSRVLLVTNIISLKENYKTKQLKEIRGK